VVKRFVGHGEQCGRRAFRSNPIRLLPEPMYYFIG
jgi:hypothetical protein